MKKIWIPVIVAMAAASGNGAENHDPNVVVFLHYANQNPTVIMVAEGQAKRMLALAGISVAWRVGTPDYRGPAEVIEAFLVSQPDPEFRPGALAFAVLGSQTTARIEVFYNRIRGTETDSGVPPILAHVLVHEITHILEGVERHSETGVMKSHWTGDDWQHMRYSGLRFADEDLRLLQAWVSRHDRNLVAEAR